MNILFGSRQLTERCDSRRWCGHSLIRRRGARQSEERFHGAFELLEMIFERRSYRIQPMRSAQVVLEIIARRHRIDPELDDVQTRVRCELHLPQDLLGVIRMLGKN